jgi:hypothetical protein
MFSLLRFFSPIMTYETIKEPIEVMAIFHKEHAEPTTFKWGARYYQINKVNLVHSEHDGREMIYYFSVSNDTASYRLSFRTKSLKWMLEEMCAG